MLSHIVSVECTYFWGGDGVVLGGREAEGGGGRVGGFGGKVDAGC